MTQVVGSKVDVYQPGSIDEFYAYYPSEASVGDLLLVFVSIVNFSGPTLTPPSGWSSLGQETLTLDLTSGEVNLYGFYKLLVEGEGSNSEVFSVDSGSDAVAVYCVAVTGIRSTNPVENSDYGSQANTDTVDLVSLLTFSEDVKLLHIVGRFQPVGVQQILAIGEPLYTVADRFYVADVDSTYAMDFDLLQADMSEVGLGYPTTASIPTGVCDWISMSVVVVSQEYTASFQDNYKSKLMRSMIPKPLDKRLSSVLGKVVTIISTADNTLGGLFGDADFLPDEEP